MESPMKSSLLLSQRHQRRLHRRRHESLLRQQPQVATHTPRNDQQPEPARVRAA